MTRIVFAVLLALVLDSATAASCSVAGTAYDSTGKPLRNAVVRLVSAQTGRASFAVTDANATFQLSGSDGTDDRYRVDLLSHPTVVTGSHIPTRSILGTSPEFVCRGSERQDVRALIE